MFPRQRGKLGSLPHIKVALGHKVSNVDPSSHVYFSHFPSSIWHFTQSVSGNYINAINRDQKIFIKNRSIVILLVYNTKMKQYFTLAEGNILDNTYVWQQERTPTHTINQIQKNFCL